MPVSSPTLAVTLAGSSSKISLSPCLGFPPKKGICPIEKEDMVNSGKVHLQEQQIRCRPFLLGTGVGERARIRFYISQTVMLREADLPTQFPSLFSRGCRTLKEKVHLLSPVLPPETWERPLGFYQGWDMRLKPRIGLPRWAFLSPKPSLVLSRNPKMAEAHSSLG